MQFNPIKLSISKEFVLFALSFSFLISVVVWSPNHFSQLVRHELLPIVNDILDNSNRNYDAIIDYQNKSDMERKKLTEEVIGLLLLYLIDIEEDLDRDLVEHGYIHGDKIKINETHITLTDNRTIIVPDYVDAILKNKTNQ